MLEITIDNCYKCDLQTINDDETIDQNKIIKEINDNLDEIINKII